MFIHYNNGECEKLIKNVLCIDIIDGEHPAYVTLANGTELHIRLDRIETICDDEILKKEREKKMTDEEIVEALEEEIYLAEYKDDFFATLTRVSLLKEALSLINRQRIEIEGLKRDYMILNKRFE